MSTPIYIHYNFTPDLHIRAVQAVKTSGSNSILGLCIKIFKLEGQLNASRERAVQSTHCIHLFFKVKI